MQVVCETTQATDIHVKVAALQCLVKIMSLYYQYMESYMGPALFAITLDAMKSSEDEVALQVRKRRGKRRGGEKSSLSFYYLMLLIVLKRIN